MDILFKDERQRALFESRVKLTKLYGKENADLVERRLENLFIADNLEELRSAPGHLHQLTGDRAGTFAFRLSGGMRLVFEPRDPVAARDPDGDLHWSLIRSVRILEIVNYHD